MTSQRLQLMLMLLAVITDDVRAHVELIGAGATAPATAYIAWMAAYRSLRRPFVDVRLYYHARGSGFGKRAIASGSVSYAGSDSLLSSADYDKNRDLQMFPSVAMSVSRAVVNTHSSRFLCLVSAIRPIIMIEKADVLLTEPIEIVTR